MRAVPTRKPAGAAEGPVPLRLTAASHVNPTPYPVVSVPLPHIDYRFRAPHLREKLAQHYQMYRAWEELLATREKQRSGTLVRVTCAQPFTSVPNPFPLSDEDEEHYRARGGPKFANLARVHDAIRTGEWLEPLILGVGSDGLLYCIRGNRRLCCLRALAVAGPQEWGWERPVPCRIAAPADSWDDDTEAGQHHPWEQWP